jgi:hypothetical protein
LSGTYRIQVRLNVRADTHSLFLERVTGLVRELGLRARKDTPGLLEADGLDLIALGKMVSHLGELPTDFDVATYDEQSGLIDDLWIHLSRERPARS